MHFFLCYRIHCIALYKNTCEFWPAFFLLTLSACTKVVCVCYCASCYIPVYIRCHWAFRCSYKICIVWISLCSKVLVIFLTTMAFSRFVELPLERDSKCFISRRWVCRSSNSSYNSTNSSLVTVAADLAMHVVLLCNTVQSVVVTLYNTAI